MFERRPMWALIVGLNVCFLIWRMSVQEPPMFDAATVAVGSADGSGEADDRSLQDGVGLSYEDYHQGAAERGVYSKQQQPLQQPWRQEAARRHRHPNDFVYIKEPQQEQLQAQLYAGKHLLSERLLQANETVTAVAVERKFGTERRASQPRRTKGIDSEESPKQGASLWDIVTNINTDMNSPERSSKGDYNTDNKTLSHSSRSNGVAGRPSTTATPLVIAVTPQSAAGAEPRTTPSSHFPARPDPSDYSQLMDLHDFKYLMTQPPCSESIAALIMIHTAPRYFEKRSLIRETWGSSPVHGTPLRLIFLLGAVDDPELQYSLEKENGRYGDMVQGSFVDDYQNMTYKHVMAFKWFLQNCGHAQILIKVDDDVFVNTPQLLRYLHNGDQNSTSTTAIVTDTADDNNVATKQQFNASHALFRHPQELLFCEKLVGSRVKRTYRSKWRVSFKEYPDRYYPPYCPGYAIIYSADVVHRLYQAAQAAKFFWIDDVLITGILAQQTNISITTSKPYVLFDNMCERSLVAKTDLSTKEFLFAWHNISPLEIRALWHLHINSAQTDSSAFSGSNSDREQRSPTSSQASATAAFSIPLPASAIAPVNGNDYTNHEDLYASYSYENLGW